jgi:oligopeptide transport system substrate-binding protein
MAKRNFIRFVALVALIAGAFAPFATVSAAVVGGEGILTLTSPMVQDAGPVTNYLLAGGQISTFDPQIAEDAVSITPIENMFLGLTDADPKTTAVRPEMATEWKVNEAGDVWTFTLRTDVPWVRYDPQTKEVVKLRNVTAQDFVYGIRRACDPRTGGYYGSVAAAMIKGCDVTYRSKPQDLKEDSFEQVGVKALSDSQLEVTTQGALGYWLSASGMWVFRATPSEVIAEFGEKWTEIGNIVTNGPYVLTEYDPATGRKFAKNPHYPEVNDRYGGNVEVVDAVVVNDAGTAFSLYQNNQIDSVGVPASELQRIRQDPELSKELRQNSDLAVFYFGFTYDKPPFDNVHARRAFSAIIDRQQFVSEVAQGRGVPMAHFMPPGIRGAVPVNEVGIGQPNTPGFDPELAKAELAKAGYPNCENLPEINVITFEGASAWGEFLQQAAQTHLGCDPAKIVIEENEFTVLLKAIKRDVPTPQRPNMFTLGWGPDYPDGHNWMHDVLSCNAENNFARPCDEVLDGKIDRAGKETDPAKREALYRELEEDFFGPNGNFPIAPLYLRINIFMVKPWYTGFFDTDGLFGGAHWDSRAIDQAAQLAARGR